MRRQNIKNVPFAKYIAATKDERKEKNIVDSILKMVGVVSGATAIFAALFYVFGRNYATGYFGAMNVPEYLLSFSVREYAAVAWFPMIFLIGIFIIPTLIIPLFDLLFVNLLKKLFTRLTWRKKSKKLRMNEYLKEKEESVFHFLYVFLFIGLCYLFYKGIMFTSDYGNSVGRSYLLNRASMVELHFFEPLPINALQNNNLNGSTNTINTYSEFRLITKNNGKYYLFKELDPETCKPKQVYIIDESKIDQVILSPAEDISDQCAN